MTCLIGSEKYDDGEDYYYNIGFSYWSNSPDKECWLSGSR